MRTAWELPLRKSLVVAILPTGHRALGCTGTHYGRPEFEAEERRQSLLVAQSPEEADIQAFIDSVSEWPDDDFSS